MSRRNEITHGFRQSIFVPQSDSKTRMKAAFSGKFFGFIAVCAILLVTGSVALQNNRFLDLFTSPAVEQAGPKPLVPHPPAFAYVKGAHQENTALVLKRSSHRVVPAFSGESVLQISRQFGGPAEVSVETSYPEQEFLQEIDDVANTKSSGSGDVPPDLSGNGIIGGISPSLGQSDLSFLNTGRDSTTDLTSSRAVTVRFPGQP